ncbi:MAG: hypothetical protein V4671_30690 [Armatimonadota bacterium]
MSYETSDSPMSRDAQAAQDAIEQYRKSGNDAGVQERFKSAIASNPDSPDLLLMGAHACAFQGKFEEAWSLTERVKSISPTNASAYILEAWLYNQEGDTASALAALDTASVNNSGELELTVIEGYKAFYAKDWRSSLQWLEIAHRKIPSDSGLSCALAQTLIGLKRYKEARTAVLSALDTEPHSYSNLYTLGVVEEYLGDKPGAALAYEKAISVNPALTAAEVCLLRLDMQALKWGAAVKRFRRIVQIGSIHHR